MFFLPTAILCVFKMIKSTETFSYTVPEDLIDEKDVQDTIEISRSFDRLVISDEEARKRLTSTLYTFKIKNNEELLAYVELRVKKDNQKYNSYPIDFTEKNIVIIDKFWIKNVVHEEDFEIQFIEKTLDTLNNHCKLNEDFMIGVVLSPFYNQNIERDFCFFYKIGFTKGNYTSEYVNEFDIIRKIIGLKDAKKVITSKCKLKKETKFFVLSGKYSKIKNILFEKSSHLIKNDEKLVEISRRLKENLFNQ